MTGMKLHTHEQMLFALLRVSLQGVMTDKESILYPKFVIGYVPVKGKLNILSYKLRRFMYIHRLISHVLDWPMWKPVWESVVNYLREPETIFHTKAK